MTEKLSVNPHLVRQFAAHGEGDFKKLRDLLDATCAAWAEDYGQQRVLVTYPLYLGTDELVDRILSAIENCGYRVTKTRIHTITGSMVIMPGEAWREFSEFQEFRRFCGIMPSAPAVCAVPGVLYVIPESEE